MPYSNLPKSKWPAMERCVAHVKAKGGVKNAYAVCYASVTGTRGKKRSMMKKALNKTKKK